MTRTAAEAFQTVNSLRNKIFQLYCYHVIIPIFHLFFHKKIFITKCEERKRERESVAELYFVIHFVIQ